MSSTPKYLYRASPVLLREGVYTWFCSTFQEPINSGRWEQPSTCIIMDYYCLNF